MRHRAVPRSRRGRPSAKSGATSHSTCTICSTFTASCRAKTHANFAYLAVTFACYDGALRPGEILRQTLSGGGHVLVHDFCLQGNGNVVFHMGKTKTERQRRVRMGLPISQDRPSGVAGLIRLHLYRTGRRRPEADAFLGCLLPGRAAAVA